MAERLTLEDLRAEHFEPLLERAFEVRWPDVTEQIILTAVNRLPGEPDPNSGRVPFSLQFQGTSTVVRLNQAIYLLEHEALGLHEIFLVPVGREPDGTFTYEAIFT